MQSIQGLFPINILFDNFKSGLTEDQMDFVTNREWFHVRSMNPNLRSSATDILDSEQLLDLRKFIDDTISVYASKVMGITNAEFYITQSWANRNPTGREHHIHNHPNSIISGVFYVKSKAETGAIRFHKANEVNRTIHFSDIDFNNYNSPYADVYVENNDLILFPSTLSHSVNVNEDSEDRISIAFNTFVRGGLGSIDSLTKLELK